MYDFKNIPGNPCYYSDTDSIFLKEKLNEEFIGSEMGQFKLEYEIDRSYFIAPKVYYVKKKMERKKLLLKV
jgi:hypothetical protein